MLKHLFNTLAIKREKNYALICKTFKEKEITTETQIQQCRKTMLANAKVCVAFVALISASLAIILSKLAWFIILSATMLILYMIHSVCQGRELAQRYLDEVINAPPKEGADECLAEKDTETEIEKKRN